MNREHFEVLLKDMNGKMDILIGNQGLVVRTAAKVEIIEQDLQQIKSDVVMIKYAVRGHDLDLKQLKKNHPDFQHSWYQPFM